MFVPTAHPVELHYCFFQPPIVPQVTHPGDSRNFDKYPEDGWLTTPPVTESELEPFNDF